MVDNSVALAMSELQLADKVIRFPNYLSETLDAETYTRYFEAISTKLKRVKKTDYHYDEFQLTQPTDDALKALSDFLEKKPAIFFKTLTLDLSTIPSVNEEWLTRFCGVLSQLSRYDIHQVQFKSAEGLTDTHINTLMSLIEKNPSINVDLCLPPPYQFQLVQQTLDKLISKRANIRQKISLEEGKAPSSTSTNPPRKRTGNFTATLDVQIQETQQQETSQETNLEFANLLESEGKVEAYTIDSFTAAWQAGQFKTTAKSHYLDSSRAHAHQLWCNWVGAFNRRGALLSTIKLTHRACETLLRYSEQFQFGIDFQVLPAGFLLEEKEEEIILDFDERLARITSPKPLAVSLMDYPAPKPMLHEAIDALSLSAPLLTLWNQVNAEPYDKTMNRLFRQYLPDLQRLNPEELIQFFQLSTSGNRLNASCFQFLLESAIAIANSSAPPSMTDSNLRAQLINQVGEENSDVAAQWILNFPKITPTKHITGDAEALKIIDSFSDTQKAWWDALFAQHYAANNTIDKLKLVKAFIVFKGELDNLFKRDVNLPANCQFTNVKNLPNALSRMLTILKHVDESNREAQLELLAGLDLSSTGVIKLAKKMPGRSWAFFTPEMQLTPEDAYLDSLVTEYAVPEWPWDSHDPYLTWGVNVHLVDNNSIDRVHPYINPGIYIYSKGKKSKIASCLFSLAETTRYVSIRKNSQTWIYYEKGVPIIEGLSEHIPRLTRSKKGEEQLLREVFHFAEEEIQLVQEDIRLAEEEEQVLGETWQDYHTRITVLLKNKQANFLTEKEFKKLHIPRNNEYLRNNNNCLQGYDDAGINVYFLSTLPNINEDSDELGKYRASLLYVKPNLYRINAENQWEKVTLKSNTSFEELILKGVDKAKTEFQKKYPDASSQELALFDFNFANLPANDIKSWFINSVDMLPLLEIKPALEKRNVNLEQTVTNFFRYSAFQDSQHSIPLKLCQYINEKLNQEKLSNPLKAIFYTVLAGSLANPKSNLEDVEKIKPIIDKIIQFKIPPVTPIRLYNILMPSREEILNRLVHDSYKEIFLPPLDCLNLFFSFFAKAELGHNLLVLDGFSRDKESLKDYTDVDLEKAEMHSGEIHTHLLITHFNMVEAIDRFFYPHVEDTHTVGRNFFMAPTNEVRTGIQIYLSGLISSFHLNAPCKFKTVLTHAFDFDTPFALNSSLFKLLERFYEEKKEGVLLEALTLLNQINVRQSGLKEPLTHANFEDILTQLLATQKPVKTFLEEFKVNKHRLVDYFPNKQIEPNPDEYTVPATVQTQIDAFFTGHEQQRQLSDFLTQFRDASHYAECINRIIRIAKKLDPTEHQVFIKRLIAARGLYTPITTLDPAYSSFMKLLDTVDRTGEHNKFMYMLEFEHQLTTEKTTNLAERHVRYFEKINPKTQKFLLCSLNQTELTERFTRTLSASPMEEFNREGCSLLFHEAPPTAALLSTLQLPHHAAYIYAEGELYYVNQARNLCEKINLDVGKHQAFLDRFPQGLQHETLNEDQLTYLNHYYPHTDDYAYQVTRLYSKIDQLIKTNIGVKTAFLALFDAYHQKKIGSTPFLSELHAFVDEMAMHFSKLADNRAIIALCLRFQTAPEVLSRSLTLLPKGHERLFTQILISAMKDEGEFDEASFSELCEKSKTHPNLINALELFHKRPPYPPLKTLLDWHAGALNSDMSYEDVMNKARLAQEKAPFPRSPDNGFKEAKAITQLALIKENNQAYDKGDFNAGEFAALTERLREETTDNLLALMTSFKGNKNPSYETLIAVGAELLYRSTGKELNTTQYLSSLVLLKTSGHVTSQIDTSEGKSRIMMLTSLCQAVLGKTVDFVTSDMHLAAREFVDYQPAFALLDLPTQLIYANMPPSAYQKQGINFSDATNLILFRNRAHSLQQGHEVLDEVPERRCLQLDEADKVLYDAYSSRHNFSAQGDALLRDMPWIYSLLVGYFMQSNVAYNPLDLFKNDIDRCRETFVTVAKNHPICIDDESRIDRLEALPQDKIEEWQTMAYVAMQQRYRRDFDIKTNQLLQTEQGLQMASETVLVIDNQWAEHSRLSFGAEQCQKAYLNYLRQNPDKNPDPELKEALAECDYRFHVPNEKQIVYSSTSKNFLDDYKAGEIKAVTGTAGSLVERHEARCLYQSLNPNRAMTFIDMPREKAKRRRDKAIYLTADTHAQFEALVDQIKLAQANKQPILIIAEDGRESHALFTKLQARIARKPSLFSRGKDLSDTSQLQLVNPELSPAERANCIKKAGEAGQITISTGTLGRGTDISLQSEEAAKHGLMVINTFLPAERDKTQYAGRAARYGQKGSYIAILNKQRLKKALNKTTLTDGFYTHTEDYIRYELEKKDKTAQVDRLLEHTVGDFRYQLTRHFFDMLERVTRPDMETLLPLWSAFFARSDQVWNAMQADVRQALSEKKMADAQEKLRHYSEQTLEQWENLRAKIAALHVSTQDNVPVEEVLKNPAQPLTFDDITQSLLQQTHQKNPSLQKIHAYDTYEEGHDGRAIKYRSFVTFLKASVKGWANLLPGVNFKEARRPFANIRAWFEGRGQLFVNFRASQNKGLILASMFVGSALIMGSVLTLLVAPFAGWVVALSFVGLVVGVGLTYSAISGITGSILDRITESTPDTSTKEAPHPSWQNTTQKSKLTTAPDKSDAASYAPLFKDTSQKDVEQQQEEHKNKYGR